MIATLVHANPGTAQGLFLAAALVFVFAVVVEAVRDAGPVMLAVTAGLCLMALGLLFLA